RDAFPARRRFGRGRGRGDTELLLEELPYLLRSARGDPEVLREAAGRRELEGGTLRLRVDEADAAQVLDLLVGDLPDHPHEHALEDRLVVGYEREGLQRPRRHLYRRHGVDARNVVLLELEGVPVAHPPDLERRLSVLVRLFEGPNGPLDRPVVFEPHRARELLHREGLARGEEDRLDLEDQFVELRGHVHASAKALRRVSAVRTTRTGDSPRIS